MPSTLQLTLPLAHAETEPRTGILSRLFAALFDAARIDRIIDARQQRVEAKVARFLERQGADRMTDSLERDIARFL